MTWWRWEWLGRVRTPRAVSRAAVFVAIGLIEPVTVAGGTYYDGEAVTFDADLDVGEELGLNPALVVTDTTTLANVTVKIVVGSWFVAADSTVLNPQTGNHGGPNESVILENIKQSMQAFEDDNRTGYPDR